METTKTLIKEGCLIADDLDYITDKGVRITREYTGRRGNTLKWRREDDGFYYRGLYEAYYRLQYK